MQILLRRSREGAWIEIVIANGNRQLPKGRSREGAWIEIPNRFDDIYMQNGRSREGAWIEISSSDSVNPSLSVAPVRERGLKYTTCQYIA